MINFVHVRGRRRVGVGSRPALGTLLVRGRGGSSWSLPERAVGVGLAEVGGEGCWIDGVGVGEEAGAEGCWIDGVGVEQ